MNADGSVATVPVQVGLVTTSMAQVTSGLSAGESVVTGTVAARTGTSNSTTSGINVNSLTGGGGFGGAGGFR
jgi:hypothetical protein